MAVTTTADELVGQACLRARVVEAAVHQPLDWKLKRNDVEMGVHVEIEHGESEDGRTVAARFVAGPMPEGTFYLMLECAGVPMFSAEVHFHEPGHWWMYTVIADIH